MINPWQERAPSRIALIDPDGFRAAARRQRPARKLIPHTGLAYLAASLERNGDTVRVLDAAVSSYREIQQFLSRPADLFGVSTVSFTYRDAVAAAQAVKRRYPASPVVFGGPHVSIDPAGCLADPAVDYAFRGEGEEALIDFLEVLKRQTAPEPGVLAKIPGLVFRDRGAVTVNPPAPRIRRLDDLPFPAWHLFPMRRYRQHALLTSRGCPMDCAFCSIRTQWGPQWIHRDPAQVAAEVAWLQKSWGRKVVHINDDNLTMSRQHVEQFCTHLLEKRLRVYWVAQGVRADAITPDLMRLMRRAGCLRVSLGIESVDPGVLQAIGKRETPQDFAAAIAACRAAGIQVLGMFMVGNPGDTAKTVGDSVRFAQEQGIDLPAFYMALPYPGTRLWDFAKTKARLVNEDYLDFNHNSPEPVFETPEFSLEDRRRAYALARRFARRQFLRYHVTFWWPGRLWRRNGYEIRRELMMYVRGLLLPFRALRRLLAAKPDRSRS